MNQSTTNPSKLNQETLRLIDNYVQDCLKKREISKTFTTPLYEDLKKDFDLEMRDSLKAKVIIKRAYETYVDEVVTLINQKYRTPSNPVNPYAKNKKIQGADMALLKKWRPTVVGALAMDFPQEEIANLLGQEAQIFQSANVLRQMIISAAY